MGTLAQNRRAKYDFSIEETYNAGIVLLSTEVKSLRAARVSLKGSFCIFVRGELWLRGAHIAEYAPANNNHDAYRDRKLLLTNRELEKLKIESQQGKSIVPLKFIASRAFIKLHIGIGRPKKQYDKRADLRRQDDQRRTKISLA